MLKHTAVLLAALIAGAATGYWLGYKQGAEANSVELTPQIPTPDSTTTSERPKLADSNVGSVTETVSENAKATPTSTQSENSDEESSDVAGIIEKVKNERAGVRQAEPISDDVPDEDIDWQAQTEISDFFILHPLSDNVDLQHLRCTEKICDIIGQFDGAHEQWETIVDDLRGQQWWHYSSVSSSSKSEDSVTYFVLHVRE
ncbi:hypothetical protein [Aestuariibacter salexigens]|uniref:hypothetical protein n=1 Tax=Aestuariibacter salexigens TaxID=226010 RepID=UPI000403E4E3|nr:hypothetical protein [Aestuariibacter salexigens]